ncbi:glucuronosyltransferase [Trifolium repens]|nr:glucuronosyltransferase [Trifolium repens]
MPFSSSITTTILAGFFNMGGSKCSSSYAISGANSGGTPAPLPRCGCNVPMKLWLSNIGLNPKRKFWKCRNIGMDGCDFLVWDDELEEVEAANLKSRFMISPCN